ncbi:type I-F CRISPR-associated protein Csy2 [Limnohabitans sp. Jir72]|uniref:type I-F CRISPR-associated protein Csy2 n=1 Tax=Limnohabitans sp. Jir72 TaxID=1977909 RepID=UPI000D3A3D17|nr:type I-F CRISPR-associated protein Csy2 [Limnohabitans sp. Jir72]PUE28894.1 type I-F CRISPR-associated protein Csy2 [Limnohabitans sp. Jir72]
MKPERFEAVLLLPRLRVQNANAISSPLTWGFPPPSAFTGFAHALQRRLNSQGLDLRFGSVGIACHQFEPQTFQPPGRYTQVFNLTRNPLDKDGNTQAIVEEGRTHMEVSLLITVSGDDCPLNDEQCKALAAKVLHQAEGMRLAGGSILHNPQRGKHPAQWIDWPTNREGQTSAFAQLRRHLAPGFVLVSRAQLLADHVNAMQKVRAESTALDALLDLCALHHTPPTLITADAENAKGEGGDAADVEDVNAPAVVSKDWTVSRRKPGWLVPLPVGYAAISPLYAPGDVKNARDNDTPFRFVESVLSLGEWVGPHRIKNLNDLLWRHHAQPEAGLYVTHNGTAVTSPTPTSTPV